MTEDRSDGSSEKATPAEGEMARPPSVLWLVIPLVLIMIYAAMR